MAKKADPPEIYNGETFNKSMVEIGEFCNDINRICIIAKTIEDGSIQIYMRDFDRQQKNFMEKIVYNKSNFALQSDYYRDGDCQHDIKIYHALNGENFTLPEFLQIIGDFLECFRQNYLRLLETPSVQFTLISSMFQQ